MIKVFDDNKNICECCDNDSSILIDFAEDTKPTSLGTRVYLCEDCKRYLIDNELFHRSDYFHNRIK